MGFYSYAAVFEYRQLQFRKKLTDMFQRSTRPISAIHIARLAHRAGVGDKSRVKMLHRLGATARQLERDDEDGKHWYWALPDLWERYDQELDARQVQVWARERQIRDMSVNAALRIIDPDETPANCIIRELRRSVFLPDGDKPEEGAEWFALYIQYAVRTGRLVIRRSRSGRDG